MDIIIELIVLFASAYYANQEYENNRIGWAMAWSVLVGWNIHTLLGLL